MDNLDDAFTIEVNGKPIAKISDSETSRTQAQVATGTDAAVFTLKNSRLQCGGWMLGRNLTEDRSMLPKKVLWFKLDEDNEKIIRPVAAENDGDSYTLTFGGARLIEEDGNVFANLMGGDEAAKVIVKMQ